MYLAHHGIKGQKWGVRRFQNKDGTWTKEGKERRMYANRVRRAAKTKSDMDRLYNTLSKEDKRLIGDDKGLKEWLTIEEGSHLVKRFLTKHGDTPIAALDILDTPKADRLAVAIMTDPKYRGSGEASKLAKKGYDWFNKNASKYGATSIEWTPYAENTASRRIAEKTGFVYDKKNSNDIRSIYVHKIQKKD